jgi:hypothetical protein
MKFLLLFILSLFPALAFASGMTKQEACAYPDGIHREEVYVLWPGKIVQIDEFLKKDGFLYYFIQSFPSWDMRDRYRSNGNNPETSYGYVRTAGSYFVSFDCTRSKVKFYPHIRSGVGTAFGRIHWISGQYLDFSLVGDGRDPCTTGPDSLLDLSTMALLRIDKLQSLPRSTTAICVGRSPYKNTQANTIQFDIEQYQHDTEESFYSRYQYHFSQKKLKKIR